MKTYIGTKTIKAKPMTRQEYCDYRGWDLPADENGGDQVMLVEYPVDPQSKPNHPNHEGYISMSPMQVFEKAYNPADTWMDRLKIEYMDLCGKIDKLSDTLNLARVPEVEAPILQVQLVAMKDYAAILAMRIGVGQEVSFGIASAAMKAGFRVARVGWNGKGLFVFKQVPADISVKQVVPNMQSLPESVKDEFIARLHDAETIAGTSVEDIKEVSEINYRNQFCIVYPDNTIYAWAPSANDTCNDDWIILGYEA